MKKIFLMLVLLSSFFVASAQYGVYISGPTEAPSGAVAKFTIHNLPAGATVEWASTSPSPGYYLTGSGGSNLLYSYYHVHGTNGVNNTYTYVTAKVTKGTEVFYVNSNQVKIGMTAPPITCHSANKCSQYYRDNKGKNTYLLEGKPYSFAAPFEESYYYFPGYEEKYYTYEWFVDGVSVQHNSSSWFTYTPSVTQNAEGSVRNVEIAVRKRTVNGIGPKKTFVVGVVRTQVNETGVACDCTTMTNNTTPQSLMTKSLTPGIKVYSIMGDLVHSQSYSEDFNIKNTNLNSGVYIVEIVNESGHLNRSTLKK